MYFLLHINIILDEKLMFAGAFIHIHHPSCGGPLSGHKQQLCKNGRSNSKYVTFFKRIYKFNYL